MGMLSNPTESFTPLSIQSNAIRGRYMKDIIYRTMNELHDIMTTVFGPYATDAWITQNGHPYYTRDGKEVFRSIHLDNELSTYIQKILFQAAENQARKVGDGTTTLFVFYTNLYRVLYESFNKSQWSLTELRSAYMEVINRLNTYNQQAVVPATSNRILSMLYTCTQDAHLAASLYSKIGTALLNDAYIMVEKSNIEQELDVSVNEHPILKVTRVYESKASSSPIIDNASAFFIHGQLDIAHIETIEGVCSIGLGQNAAIRPTIVFICSGITAATRNTLREFDKLRIKNPNYNQIAIYTLDGYMGYDEDEIDDLVAYINHRPGKSGMENSISFEAYLYRTFVYPNLPEGIDPIESLMAFDADQGIVSALMQNMVSIQSLEYGEGDGLKFSAEPCKYSRDRYDALRKQIENEKSEITRIKLTDRLRKLYGEFIDVRVGSKLIKDSQRKYELVVDATVSARDAVKYGVFEVNSIYQTILSSYTMSIEMRSPIQKTILACIREALTNTLIDMIRNKIDHDKMDKEVAQELLMRSGSVMLSDDIPDRYNPELPLSFDMSKNSIPDMFDATLPTPDPIEVVLSECETVMINPQVVEPCTVMSNLLENSVMMLELAMAKTFNLEGYLNNYIK